jgi:lipoyl(octanoyl) transferase
MRIDDLGLMPYRDAWRVQERVHAEVAGGGEERVLLVEHPPVITFGRRPGVAENLIASAEQLARMGVEVVQSDRGGDITFHGPGQLIAYPILRLADHRLLAGSYVCRLLHTVIATLAEFGIEGKTEQGAPGVWVSAARKADTHVAPTANLAKICAVGVRIRRGVSMHGIALNVTTDLDYFNLIVPCGLAGRGVTSMQKILRDATPPIAAVKRALATQFCW